MIKIDYVDKLHPIFTKKKRIKIILGGRNSTKSTAVADYVIAKMSRGGLWCCARENQNSIEESVHRSMIDEIDRLGFEGFDDTKTSITHSSGGRSFYKGLARNVTSLKSTLSGVQGLWIEEGEDVSDASLNVLTKSVRLNAKDTVRYLAGEKVDMPEILITMNRGARSGAIAQKFLKRADSELSRCGYYEDDLCMIALVNYTDMPRSWFLASGLEEERLDDLARMSTAQYRHEWHADYLDDVDNAIIKAEWFDACIDAHKLDRLKKAFNPQGGKFASHDPSDKGKDSKGYVLRHGSIFKKIKEKTDGEIDEGCDWATQNAINDGADWFIWDGDGMGAGLKRQVSTAFKSTRIKTYMFRGSLSGSGQDNAKDIYLPCASDDSNINKPKTYSETFTNNRSQYSISLADRFYNTYKSLGIE